MSRWEPGDTPPTPPNYGDVEDEVCEALEFILEGFDDGETSMSEEGDRRELAAELRRLADQIDPPTPLTDG